MIRILLADDLGMMLHLLRGLCESDGGFEVVGAVETGEEAIELALRIKPDVMVLDIKLPGISGLEVARRLTRRLPDTKIVVLTALDSYGFAARAMAAGAQAFLTKQAVVRELVNAIRKVYAGGNYLDSEMAQRMALAHIREEGSPVDKLSDREIDVLLLMLRGHTTAEISEKLALAAKTVEHHRRSIGQKLNVTTDAQLGVVAGLEVGDRLVDDRAQLAAACEAGFADLRRRQQVGHLEVRFRRIGHQRERVVGLAQETGVLAVRATRMDLFGVIIVGVVTAVGGGTIRDIILDVPVFWIEDTRPTIYLTCGRKRKSILYAVSRPALRNSV